MRPEIVEKVQTKVQAVTNFTAPTGGTVAILGGITLNEWLAIGGFILALGSFIINWYYQDKRFRLLEKKHKNGD